MSWKKYILTLDVGTTSVKTCLFDEELRLAAFSSAEYTLQTPCPDIVELDPQQYWQACVDGIRTVLWESKAAAEDVKVITLTTQGETLIPVDPGGNPLMNALVWLDARATAESAELSGRFSADAYYQRTGLPEVGPANPVAKILWIKNHEPEIFRACSRFLLLEDFLIYQLTGKLVSEPSLASSTGYFDFGRDNWWGEILDFAEIPMQRFPEILPCGHPVGTLTKSTAQLLGLPESVLVTTGAMDQIAAALAVGNFRPGKVSETTGTALIVAASTSSPDFRSAVKAPLYRHYRPGLYLLIPYCPTAGIILKWFKDEFCAMETAEAGRRGLSVYQVLDELAEKVPPGSHGLLLLPHFAGALSPDLNHSARGVLFGLGLQTRKAHLIRAALESVGYLLRENVELFEQLGVSATEIYSVGGGAASPLWNSIKADIIGRPVVVTTQEECASLGAAMLGSVAAGWYKNVEDAWAQLAQGKRAFLPNPAHQPVYERGYRHYQKLYSCLKDFFVEVQA